MYKAKETGKGRYDVFHPSMREAVVKRHGLKEELQAAIEGGQVVVEYQPIMDLATGRSSAAEALVRWNHPDRGRLLPSRVRPARRGDRPDRRGRTARAAGGLPSGLRLAGAHRASQGMAVHVNLSAVELKDPALAATVRAALESMRPRSRSARGRDHREPRPGRRRERVGAADLREMGVSLALDDFGTGYSSLSYLRSLPLDILKIAKPFVEGLARGRQENSFVRMIVDLARALDLRSWPRASSRPRSCEALRELGCDLGQGFFLAYPLDITHTPLPALLDDVVLGRREVLPEPEGGCPGEALSRSAAESSAATSLNALAVTDAQRARPRQTSRAETVARVVWCPHHGLGEPTSGSSPHI